MCSSDLSSIGYTMAGTYFYEIYEMIPGDAQKEGGMTYSGLVYDVKVTVVEVEGALQATAVYSLDGEEIQPEAVVFANHYVASGSWVPEVSKVLSGRTLAMGEFSFDIFDENGVKLNAAPVLNGYEGDPSRVVFPAINFTQEDIGKSFKHTIKEVPGDLEGVTYDPLEIQLEVTIADAGGGKLLVALHHSADMVFDNVYTPPLVDVSVEKTWVGGPAQKPAVTIELLQNGTAIKSVVLDGVVDESETQAWKYTWTGLPKYDDDLLAYTYKVAEKTVPDYTSEVTSNGLAFTVENTYVPPTVDVIAEKIWTDGASGAPAIEVELYRSGTLIDTAVVDGTVDAKELSAWRITWTGLPKLDDAFAEWNYTVKEKAVPEGYQEPVYGKADDGTLTITNTKTPPMPIKVSIEGLKKLIGRELKAGEFSFTIANKADPDKIIRTVKNAADGSFTFEIEFKLSGKYELLVKEVKGDLKDVVYDTKAFLVTTEVTVNDKGVFEAKSMIEGEKIVFENKYDAPKLPGTGSENEKIYLFAGLALVAAGVIFLARKKKPNNR